jgi:hypothetical protein
MKNKFLKTLTFLWLLALWQPANAQLWEILNPLPQGTGHYLGHFLDDNNGWVFRTDLPQLLRTRDGGNTWTELYPMTGMRYIFMADTLVGYMSVKEGWRTYLYKTTDGGLNWEQKSVFFNQGNPIFNDYYYPRKFIYFRNANEGFLVDDYSDRLFFTSDGGDTWTENLNLIAINEIAFCNDSIGWVGNGVYFSEAGIPKTIWYTENGGKTWTKKFDWLGAIVNINPLTKNDLISTFFYFYNGQYNSGFVSTQNNFQDFSINEFSYNWDFKMGRIFRDSILFFTFYPRVYVMHKDSVTPTQVADFSEHTNIFCSIEPHKSHLFLYGKKIVRYTDTAYVGITNPQPTELSKVRIFPNPAKDKLYFEGIPATGQCKISLITLTSVTVKEVYMSLNHCIDISDLQTGLYFANIQYHNVLISRKIVINR